MQSAFLSVHSATNMRMFVRINLQINLSPCIHLQVLIHVPTCTHLKRTYTYMLSCKNIRAKAKTINRVLVHGLFLSTQTLAVKRFKTVRVYMYLPTHKCKAALPAPMYLYACKYVCTLHIYAQLHVRRATHSHTQE